MPTRISGRVNITPLNNLRSRSLETSLWWSGGTIILWEALESGAITAYPEYTGTIAREILKSDEIKT